MVVETMANGVYQCTDDGEILLTITSLGDNRYRAVDKELDMTAEIIALDEYRTQSRCLSYKRADKNGKYKKSNKMLAHNLSWLRWMLEEKGFIRESKCVENLVYVNKT